MPMCIEGIDRDATSVLESWSLASRSFMSAQVSNTSCSGSMRSKFVAVRGMAAFFRMAQLCFSALHSASVMFCQSST
jgi:hypothetical protein